MTRGLAKQGVEVLFVMPKASGDEDQSAAKIINASDVESLYQYHDVEEYWKNIDFMEVGSNLMPYMDPETFTGKLIFVLKFNPIFFASFQNTLIHFPGKCLGTDYLSERTRIFYRGSE